MPKPACPRPMMNAVVRLVCALGAALALSAMPPPLKKLSGAVLPLNVPLLPEVGALPSEAEFIAAYRADVADRTLDTPVFLGTDEGEILARHLHIRAEVFVINERTPSRATPGEARPIREFSVLNENPEGAGSPHVLLFHNRHFCVLGRNPDEAGIPSRFFAHAPAQGYVEIGMPREGGTGSEPPLLVQPDGNCLITSLYFLHQGRFPTSQQIGDLRAVLARELSDDQIRGAVAEMKEDLIRNAEERPFEHGTFTGWGPRLSAMLHADPLFLDARERALKPHRAHAEWVAAASLQREKDRKAAEDRRLMPPPPPRPSAASGSHQRRASEASLIAAYRADLADADLKTPVPLPLDAGEIIAAYLEVGIEVFTVAPTRGHGDGRLRLDLDEPLHEKALSDDETRALLSHRGHFTLLQPTPSDRPGRYYFPVPFNNGREQNYDETGLVTGSDMFEAPRRIKRDGNSLITALHVIADNAFPTNEDIKEVRALVAESLSDEQVLRAVAKLRSELIKRGADRARKGWTFKNCGPRLSQLFSEDPTFAAALETPTPSRPRSHDQEINLKRHFLSALNLENEKRT